MEAIILAGGFGTRLKHLIPDLPKPMAYVCGRPFLRYILDDLTDKGVDRIILAVGYLKETIIDYFGDSYRGAEIIYSVEDDPLLTGGAIKKSLHYCEDNDVFIINGGQKFGHSGGAFNKTVTSWTQDFLTENGWNVLRGKDCFPSANLNRIIPYPRRYRACGL